MKDAQNLLTLTHALVSARANDFIKTQHAKDVFMKALEESGFNTAKPIHKELATATSPVLVTANSTSQTVEKSTIEVK